MKIKILLIGFISILFCMQSMSDAPPTFYVQHKEAKMPVVIRGNTNTHVLILFLHGGPGGTAMKKIGTRAFNNLEKEFGVVYWDQRGAHQAQGGTQKKYMNLNQFIEDLDVVVDELRSRYPHAQLFLMGHCWGGGFGTAYLIDAQRQKKIAGWIDVAGAHNNPQGDQLSAAWVKAYAQEKIKKGEEVHYWNRALHWYEKNPVFASNALGHYSFVRKSNGYQYVQGDTLGKYPGYIPSDLFRHPIKYVCYYINYVKTLNAFLISDINLTAEMKNIKTPSLILWGNKDGLIPVAMAKEAYQALGTHEEEKKLILFENTAHTIYYEQPDQFVHAVTEFIHSITPLQTFTKKDARSSESCY